MALGMTVISTRHAGIPEAIEHGVSGWLVEESDAVGMAEAMSCCSRRHINEVELGAAGQRKARQLYRGRPKKQLAYGPGRCPSNIVKRR